MIWVYAYIACGFVSYLITARNWLREFGDIAPGDTAAFLIPAICWPAFLAAAVLGVVLHPVGKAIASLLTRVFR